MANFPIKKFLGLRLTSDPEPGTARVANNFKRNRIRDQLEVSDGFTTKYSFSPTTYGISLLSPQAVASFFVPDDGGRAVTVMVATYHKATLGFSGAEVQSSGVFIRPYHTASGWVDDWREVTEFQIFRLASMGSSTITVDNSPSIGLPDDYLNGWTLIKSGDFTLTENTGLLITDFSGITLTLAGVDLDLCLDWVEGTTVLYACRGLLGRLLPHTLALNIRTLLDELRFNSGGGTLDTDVATFYRDKTFFRNNNLVRKGTFGERGNFVIPTPAFGHGAITADGSAPTTGLPSGTYTVKTTLVSDDGQESELRDALDATVGGAIAMVDSQSGGGVQRTGVKVGDYVYSLGFYQALDGYLEVYQIEIESKTVTKTLQVNDGVRGIVTDGEYLYLWRNDRSGYYWLAKYDTSLNLVAEGTPQAKESTYELTGYTAISGNYVVASKSNPGNTQKIVQWTTGLSYVGQVTLTGTEAILDVKADGSVGAYAWVSRNDTTNYRVCKITMSSLAETLINLTGVTVTPSQMTYYNGAIYVAAGTKIKKVTTADVQSDFSSGGKITASGYLCNNGTFLYDSIPSTYLIALKLTDGTEDASLATGAIYPHEIICANYSIFGYLGSNLAEYTHLPTGTTFTSGGQMSYKFKVYISPGLAPIRSKYIRVYISKDAGPYYLVETYTMLQDTETPYLDFDSGTVWLAGKKHFYYRSQFLTIGKVEYEEATINAITQIGRAITDTGEARYSYAITANKRTYLVGRTISGKLQRNRVYLSPLSGDGVAQYDIFPNDVTTVLDVEQNDGDVALALGAVADRVLVLKNRSVLMLTSLADGSHNRDIVAQGVGIAAVNSIVAFNEALYWLDHSGVWEFTTRGLKLMSEAINDQLFSYTVEQRTAAVAGVDPKNMQYRLTISTTTYVLDLRDGEWVTDTINPTYQPAWYAIDTGSTDRRFMFLGNNIVLNPAERTTMAASFTFAWESNKIELPLSMGFDGLVAALYCDYDSDQALTLSLWLDDAGSAVRSYTLPGTATGVVVPAPLSARCKSFRVRIEGTYTTTTDIIKIRRLGAYYNIIPVGGDRHRI